MHYSSLFLKKGNCQAFKNLKSKLATKQSFHAKPIAMEKKGVILFLWSDEMCPVGSHALYLRCQALSSGQSLEITISNERGCKMLKSQKEGKGITKLVVSKAASLARSIAEDSLEGRCWILIHAPEEPKRLAERLKSMRNE